VDKISPPLLQLSEVTFGYSQEYPVLKGVNIDVGLDSRMAIIGANGAGKSTLYVRPAPEYSMSLIPDRIKLLTGELHPVSGHRNANGRLRMWV
jgi:ATP-binding cassette subfamily F protein 3